MKEEMWQTFQRIDENMLRMQRRRRSSGRELMTEMRLHLEHLRRLATVKQRYPAVPWDRPAALKELLRTNPSIAQDVAMSGVLHSQSTRSEVRAAKAKAAKRYQRK